MPDIDLKHLLVKLANFALRALFVSAAAYIVLKFLGVMALELSILIITLMVLYRIMMSKYKGPVPISVNFHFSRKCNYNCGFCFHTAKTSHVASLPEIKRGLDLLSHAGMRKINFAGGEPFLYPKLLSSMLTYCKDTLHLESVSIVSNGSKITQAFLRQHAHCIDVLAISCDSFEPMTSAAIGRVEPGVPPEQHIAQLYRIAEWCKELKIAFKINTVVCRHNVDEDMRAALSLLAPFRWKVFQVLIVPGENDGDDTKRDARDLVISDEEFTAFCNMHREIAGFTPEDNRLMASSYLILDEYLCFLDKDCEGKSESILEVGVHKALQEVKWDKEAFLERGGLYNWSKASMEAAACGGAVSEDLDW